MRTVTAFLVTFSLLAALAVGGVAWFLGWGPLPDPQGCRAEVAGHKVRINDEQAQWASLIAAISVRRGMPARAASIALATAYQESKLHNIEYGDRDSLGLFQQRPSQGWGTRRQILNPVFSINAFYDALEQVDGYDTMPITEAAQAVQRSAYPNAYADHEADGRALASALTGNSPSDFYCVVREHPDDESNRLDANGLTHRAARVLRELEDAFGDQSVGGFAPGGVSTGHSEDSAHYDGRAVDIFVRPISDDNRRRGWAMASWLVANAHRLDIVNVIFDGKIWTAGDRSTRGWTTYSVKTAGKDQATIDILKHRDHVHYDVAD